MIDNIEVNTKEYNIAKSIKATNKISRYFSAPDFLFVVIYFGASYFLLKGFVHSDLRAYFYIFSLIVPIILSLRSPYNKGKKNYATIYFFVTKDTTIYKPVQNLGGK